MNTFQSNFVVKVVTMQKDESILLDQWVHHYGELFGHKNLTILDNGSTDPTTVEVLHWAESINVNVVYNYNTHADFRNKGYIIAELADRWQDSKDTQYDFLIPVDADELLAVFADNRITTNTRQIYNELRKFYKKNGAINLDISMENVPNRSGWFSPNIHFQKTILPAGKIGSPDIGFHAWELKAYPRIRFPSRLTYLHHHNPSWERSREKAKLKLQGFIKNFDDRDELLNYQSQGPVPGCHLLPMLLMTESEYYARYDNALQIYTNYSTLTNDSTVKLATMPTPVTWNGDQYVKHNPDVLNDPLGPFHHFVRHGHSENRKF